MIVPAMSVTEIQQELSNDYDVFLERAGKDIMKYRRAIVKSSKFPIYFNDVHNTPKNNNFIVFIEAKSKKDTKNPFVTIVAYYLRPEGIYAAMVLPKGLKKVHTSYPPRFVKEDKNKIVIYPPHFFERYKERYLLQDLGTLDTIKLYFKDNPTNDVQLTNENLFRGSCIHGFVFGEILSETILIVKTFISKEMLKGDQIALNEKLSKDLDEYNDIKSNSKTTKNLISKLLLNY